MSEAERRVEEPVEVVPYDPDWPSEFEAEKASIQEALRASAPEIHHVGSTAVPGLAAKPIIDILVALGSLPDRVLLARSLAPLGYVNVPYDGDEERLFFKKGLPRTHHVHVVVRGGPVYRKHLLFRDILISDPESLAEYERLKVDLAVRHRHDREAYADAKSGFIERVLSEKAGKAR